MSDEINWDRIRDLAGAGLERSERWSFRGVREPCCCKSAREVAISEQDAEDALRGLPTATTLLREIRQRIRDGSNRLGKAEDRVEELQEKGDLNGAQQVIRDVLAVETVPFYREQAKILLDELTGLADVSQPAARTRTCPTGHNSPLSRNVSSG